ncbi:MAG: beta-N-acetylhexosaminidase [Clostridia bacterium]|nr:beta-N-acetylhexosaminidase [Clostridia bacterium]
MKAVFTNIDKRYEVGMSDFMKRHSILNEQGGVEITILPSEDNNIKITKNANKVCFYVTKEYQIFRCLTHLKERVGEDSFVYEEKSYFETCGTMFDVSQASSLMTVDSVKKMLLYLVGMGYNMMMLYCEDCYELEGEPYWGNMRPRYSQSDFREIDDYAYGLGVELVPCVQTLGHLTDAIKKPIYAEISDTSSVLEVGNEKVYELIEKIISQFSKNFRSRRIHVGLDEAWDLGRGKYLQKNGYHTQTEIMRYHVSKVSEICKKYNMEPMMWSDMYFRAKSKRDVYYDRVEFDEKDRESIPENMKLVYWDYYYDEPEHYEMMINQHKYLKEGTVFAGFVRCGGTYGTHLTKTISTTNAALTTCKKEGIKDVFATIWGDDHRESSNFSILPGLCYFAEHAYIEKPDIEHVARRFKNAVCMDYEDYTKIDKFDSIPGYTDSNPDNLSISRVCMWQDVLLGLCDKNLMTGKFHDHYAELEKEMSELAEKYEEHKIMFEFYSKVARVLKTKAEIGIILEAAYRNNDKQALQNLKDVTLPELYEDLSQLRRAHRKHFFDEYKPIGWEILDIRYGGAIMRVDTAIMRLEDYLSGKIDKICELEEERLDFGRPLYTAYSLLCSASRIGQL